MVSPAAPSVSVVVPVHNEATNLPLLYHRLTTVLDGLAPLAREFIFVDDGSRDDSFAVLASLSRRDPAVKVLRFARNFGKEAAMAAGLRTASGAVVVLMDADLQHPPELIPQMVERWRAGAQMVTAVRRSRATDPLTRRLWTRAFYGLFRRVCEVEIPEGAGDFRLFDRVVVEAITSLPERNRFMKGITAWVGFRQEAIDFEPAPRANGDSSWPFLRLMKYALDGLSAFSTLPLKIWSLIGFALAGWSGLYMLWLIGKTLILGIDTPGYASLMVVTLFLSGVQLISLGVLGEYVGRIFTEVKDRPLYLVADRLNLDAGQVGEAGAVPEPDSGRERAA